MTQNQNNKKNEKKKKEKITTEEAKQIGKINTHICT